MHRRLEHTQETRRRITAAAFDLHATIGPSRTTIRAIAERAGVQRHTVYAHFPEMESLYLACTQHGMRVTGMPEPGPWLAVSDPSARMRSGLADLYGWYRANERMLRNVLEDDPGAPAAAEPDPFSARMTSLTEALTVGWSLADDASRPMLLVVVQHAMRFDTWRSLTSAGLTDAGAVELLVGVTMGVAAGTLGDQGP